MYQTPIISLGLCLSLCQYHTHIIWFVIWYDGFPSLFFVQHLFWLFLYFDSFILILQTIHDNPVGIVTGITFHLEINLGNNLLLYCI